MTARWQISAARGRTQKLAVKSAAGAENRGAKKAREEQGMVQFARPCGLAGESPMGRGKREATKLR